MIAKQPPEWYRRINVITHATSKLKGSPPLYRHSWAQISSHSSWVLQSEQDLPELHICPCACFPFFYQIIGIITFQYLLGCKFLFPSSYFSLVFLLPHMLTVTLCRIRYSGKNTYKSYSSLATLIQHVCKKSCNTNKWQEQRASPVQFIKKLTAGYEESTHSWRIIF